jgi:hypothetical protein
MMRYFAAGRSFAAGILLLALIAGCAAPPARPVLPTLEPTIALPAAIQLPAADDLPPEITSTIPTAQAATRATPVDPTGPIWIANPADRVVLRIDPARNVVAAAIPVEGEPALAVAGEGAVWVLDRAYDLLFRIDPGANRVVASVPLPAGQAETLTVGAGAVWVGMTGYLDLNNQVPGQEEELLPPGLVVKIDPRDNHVLDELPVQPVSRLVISGTRLWVLSHNVIDTPLQLYDLRSRQGMAVPLRNGPYWLPAEALAVSPDSLWLFSAAHGKIFHATPDGLIFAEIPFEQDRPTGYAEILLAQSGLWAATPWGSLLHVDPATHHLLGEVDLRTPLSGLAAGSGAIWAISQQTGRLFRVDPNRHTVAAEIAAGSPLQPTVIPSPTPRVVVWKPCPDGPTSRLKVGDIAYVTKEPPVPNRVRKEPNRQAEILGLINPGGSMDVLDGPTCADNWVWWKVKNADLEGWMAEGDAETYWMIPLYK